MSRVVGNLKIVGGNMIKTEERNCPFCGDFPKCNNAEGCDNCPEYENWLKAEEMALIKGV